MPPERSLLIVEDDEALSSALRRSFQRRGYDVHLCDSIDGLRAHLTRHVFQYAIVDLKLAGGSGLECVHTLHGADPSMKIVVLTGFASITTAVEAIKLGASHYLAKPSNADDIEAAFGKVVGDVSVGLSDRQTSIKNLEWERIHETLVDSGFNISETARRLGMHRRTLARKLAKRHLT